MPSIDHFELIAPFYDRFIRQTDQDKLIEILDLPTDGKLLDVGGGTGRVSQGLVKYANQVILVDLSLGMLHQALSKNFLKIICAGSEDLPFAGLNFERILMVDSFHHVKNQEKTVRELWRVLTPGGRLVIKEPNIHEASAIAIALFEKILFMRSHFLPPESILALFNSLGAITQILFDKPNAWIIVQKT